MFGDVKVSSFSHLILHYEEYINRAPAPVSHFEELVNFSINRIAFDLTDYLAYCEAHFGTFILLEILVHLHGRHPEAHGTVCVFHHGRDWPQATGWNDPSRHITILLSVLHVQSRTRSFHQCKNI